MAEDASKYYVLYDGECPFCNFWVNFLLKRDRKNRFLFAPLQSEFGRRFLSERNLSALNLNTVYLYKPGHFYYEKAEAAFKILSILGGIYHIPAMLGIIPSFFTDPLYDMVARHRKKITPNYCFVPTEQEKKKFLE